MIRPYYLLDTNIISELMKNYPKQCVIEKVQEYEKLCAISSTTWNELLYGIDIMPAGQKKIFILISLSIRFNQVLILFNMIIILPGSKPIFVHA